MGVEFYSLDVIPDLTLAQYSAQESGGVNEIVRKHASFYRQLNRKGLLFAEKYHLIYLYNPSDPPGTRLKIFLRIDSENSPILMQEFVDSTALSTYFHFSKVDDMRADWLNAEFRYETTLSKQDIYVSSSLEDNQNRYYHVNNWKPNEKARMLGLFQMMQKLNKPAAYVVSMVAVDYSESMKDSFNNHIQYMKNMKKNNVGMKDENAERCLKTYDKFFESLRSNPHFFCRINAYANDVAIAKMILDSAAADAVEEGNYKLTSRGGVFQPIKEVSPFEHVCIEDAPREMRKWSSVFLLKELVPFAMLPTLYSGEVIEIPKESAPSYAEEGLLLGIDNYGYEVKFPLKYLSRHALIAGVPGSGKTYTMLHLTSTLAAEDKYNIPILILEPAKKEYRAMAKNPTMQDLYIFSPGAPGAFPLRINPFQFPIGVKLSEHITNLIAVFQGAFDMEPPLPFLISEGIEQVYRDCGWYPFEINKGDKNYPTIRSLYDKVEKLLAASSYSAENKSNLKSFIQVRLGSLLTREMGNVFDVSKSTLDPEDWLHKKCVIELESLGEDASNFMTLLLLTLIREYLRKNPTVSKEKPRHIIFLEEAHNLIGPTTVANAENGNAKVASTKYIVDMLAEVRALQEAIVIADQLPTSLAPQVTKNTSLKIGHKITAMDDRQFLGSTMSADGVQLERMGVFSSGQALCIYEGVQKPFELKINTYAYDDESPSNELLYEIMSARQSYRELMDRDYQIMYAKYYEKSIKKLPQLIALMKKEVQNHLEFSSVVDSYLACIMECLLEFGDYIRMNRLAHQRGCVDLRERYNFFVKNCESLKNRYIQIMQVNGCTQSYIENGCERIFEQRLKKVTNELYDLLQDIISE